MDGNAPDSWEDHSQQQQQQAYNPNAFAFNPNTAAFNPNAGAFVPGAQQQAGGGGGGGGGGYAGGIPPPGGFGGGGYGYAQQPYPGMPPQGGYAQQQYAQQYGGGGGGYGGYGQQQQQQQQYQQHHQQQGYHHQQQGYHHQQQQGYHHQQQHHHQQRQQASMIPPQLMPRTAKQDTGPKVTSNALPEKKPVVNVLPKPNSSGFAKLSIGGDGKGKVEAKKEEPKPAAAVVISASGAVASSSEAASASSSAAAGAGDEPSSSGAAAATPPASDDTAMTAATGTPPAVVIDYGPLPEAEDIDTSDMEKEDNREHLNLVFIGHVDAGKSTIGGQILFQTGSVDQRTIEKYEREAKEKNRESWYMAYIMDTNEEERAKGKTVEVGRAHFETSVKRYTVLDAPGHKNYVPNMIAGAAQADVGVLVIAARKGEFETGFDRGGQTREHAQLAKTLGVAKLVVVVNKMDDPSICNADKTWSLERFNEIHGKLGPFLKQTGYNLKKDVFWVPISGLHGTNIKDPVDPAVCSWYGSHPGIPNAGKSLFHTLDTLEAIDRGDASRPFRMPVMDKYKDMGTMVMGKSESGVVKKDMKLTMMPNRVTVKVDAVYRDEVEAIGAFAGENLRLRISGIEEEQVGAGFVLCSRHDLTPVVSKFECQLVILELLEHNPVFTTGYKAVIHVHSVTEEVEVTDLLATIDPKTRTKSKTRPKFVKSGSIVMARISIAQPICVQLFSEYPQLGRFTLRDEGRTIAIGKVTRLPKEAGKSGASA